VTGQTTEWDRIENAKNKLQTRGLGRTLSPRVGIVLGSGLGPLADQITDKIVVPYENIDTMPLPRVEGHSGKLLFGMLSGTEVACLCGRAHLYEGHPPSDVVFGVRLLAALGVETMIITNAAGGISPDCSPGTLMVLRDHLNLTGQNPLTGANDDRMGPRFPDMSAAYDPALRALAKAAAREEKLDVAEGVYAGLLGPTYETPAEVNMLERLGADAVGMSTVLETIALRHRGVRVLGVS
jgi:purine-nucleoside phosphorylase